MKTENLSYINSDFQMDNSLNIHLGNSANITKWTLWKESQQRDDLGKEHRGSVDSKFGVTEDCA